MTKRTFIGIDLGGTNIRVGRVSGEKVVQLESVRVDTLKTEQQVIDTMCELVGRHPLADVAGIGIGVPSVVDTEQGIVYNVQNLPGWEEVHLKQIFEERFKLPTYINNDANCLALGEFHFGKGRPFRSMIGLNVGTGVAGGIIINGKLYEGRNCGAGEFGTIPFKDSILEHYCGGLFFERHYKMSGEEVAKRAAKGDLKAHAIFEEFGRYFGFCLKTILYSYDPEAIILGGSVSKSYDLYKSSMMAELRDFAYPKVLENLVIEISEREHVAILGAAALCFEK